MDQDAIGKRLLGSILPMRLLGPLASRKVRVAIATVAAAYAAQIGLHVSDDMMYTILGVGVSLILGIAHEDNGRNISASATSESPSSSATAGPTNQPA